ncbi:MAG: transporter substrate-binding domain-containing protein [Clostridiales bacterium]|nr:transporter substrate-binding domain-containing protein [Clostridiales bacterium]
MDNNYPPFVFYDSQGQLKGILVDEWALFEEKTGIEVTISAMDWSDALEGMENGHFDVIDTIFKNPEREAIYDFTEPYADIDVSIFFHRNISGINTVESIKGFSVAAKRGDQAVNVLLDAGIENITLYDSYEDIIKAASRNEVVIFVIDNPPALHFLFKYELQDTFNHTSPLYTGQFHRAVKKEDNALIQVLESGFSKITSDEKQAILDKWYGKSSIINDTLYKFIQYLLIFIVVIALALLAWNTTLRKKVHKKTADLLEAVNDLSYNKSKLHAIIESMPDWVLILHRDGQIIDFLTPKSFDFLLGQPEDFIGRSLEEIFDKELTDRFITALNEVMDNGDILPVEYSLVTDTTRYYEARFSKLNDEEVISIVRDITEKTMSQQAILKLSIMDTATNVYNRNYFESQLEILRETSLEGVSFLLVDIDGLKLVNDTQGHAMGDHYLKTVSSMLKEQFSSAEFIARIGGDEFIVVLKGLTESDVLNSKLGLQAKINALNEDGRMIPFSISIGFSTYDSTTSTVEDLIRVADDFMYREKLFHRQSTKSKNIDTLSTMLEERDFITQGHVNRMSHLIIDLARVLNTTESDMNALALFAQFHDIGKIGISDTILFKPDKLTEKEFTEMKRHSEIGFRIAESSPDLMHISEWIYKHHEWWNGKGYPFGLKGENIPMACRILTLVDAYDAMTNDRPYRSAMSDQDAIEELKRCSGTQFDPTIVDAFIKMLSGNKNLTS